MIKIDKLDLKVSSAAEMLKHDVLFFVDTTTWKINFPQFSRRNIGGP
jgi:hypothetical protein